MQACSLCVEVACPKLRYGGGCTSGKYPEATGSCAFSGRVRCPLSGVTMKLLNGGPISQAPPPRRCSRVSCPPAGPCRGSGRGLGWAGRVHRPLLAFGETPAEKGLAAGARGAHGGAEAGSRRPGPSQGPGRLFRSENGPGVQGELLAPETSPGRVHGAGGCSP